MTENIVYFKMKHEAQTYKIPIQGVNIQLKDLRQKIKEFLKMPQPIKGQSNYEELVIYAESEQIGGLEKALGLADKVRNKQTVIVVRQPYQQGQSLCDSCLCAKSNSQTPCCQRRICQGCEEQFIKFAKCFFNELQQCPFKYVNYQVQTIKQQTEISNSELEVQIKSAVFFIVKSNTEQNVILAKNHDVWATTRRNFGTLMDQFNNNKKVILIFIANRVEKFLGCAKMKNISVPRDPKWQWHGTSTIQLADNFSIEWLRKGSVDFTKLQDTINPKTGDLVIRSKDCQEVPADIGQRICLLFEQIKQNDEEQEPQPQPQQEPTPKQEDNEWDLGQIISPVKSPVREPEPKSRSRSPSPQKQQPQQPQINMQQYALFSQIIAPLYQQQKMEQDWNRMNVGKIPGLTGKVQYPHPFLQKYNQKQNKLAEALLIQMQQKQEDDKKEKEKKSSSHSKKHKKKKNRDRSSSDEKRRSRKKSKDRKDKRSKHKKRSRSRSHSRDHKKKKH